MKVILPFLFLLSFQVQPAYNFNPTIVLEFVDLLVKAIPKLQSLYKVIRDSVHPEEDVNKQILDTLGNLQKVQSEMINLLEHIKKTQSQDQIHSDFRQYLNQITEAQNRISSVYDDFTRSQESKVNEVNNSRQNFIESYKYNTIDTHLFSLKERAKGNPVPSLSPMPILLSKLFECNMTDVVLFKRDYLSLMINGYTLKVIYTNMTSGYIETVVNDSIKYINESFSGLHAADKYCMDKYQTYANTEFLEIPSLEVLHKTVQEKYIWFEAFIVSYSKSGTRYNARYSNYSGTNNVFYDESLNKVMVLCEKKGNGSACDETRVKILQDISKYQNARKGKDDNSAALHILDSIRKKSESLPGDPYAILVFAENQIKEIVSGYCANDISFTIQYDDDSNKYQVHIFYPMQINDQPSNDPNTKFTIEVSASFIAKASTPLFTCVFVFLSHFGNWQYQ